MKSAVSKSKSNYQRPTMMVLSASLVLLMLLNTAPAVSQTGDGIWAGGFYDGVESSHGTLDPVTGIITGNTYALNSFGEWETLHLTVSVNYATNQILPGNFIAAGGSWTLVVIRDNAYAGTVFGDILGGTVQLENPSRKGFESRRMVLDVRSTGGLGAFRDVRMEISGVLNMTTKIMGESGETTGLMPLYF